MSDASKITFTEGDAPATPAAGTIRLYAKVDHGVYTKDSAGVEKNIQTPLTETALADGFSIAGGTGTSRTLTVDETVTTSSKAPKESPTLTGTAGFNVMAGTSFTAATSSLGAATASTMTAGTSGLGVATATTLNGISVALSSGTSGTVRIVGGKALTVTGSVEVGQTWTAPAFDAGNFTASGSMTWTVEAGDVTTYAYVVNGHTMVVAYDIRASSVGGTPSTQLMLAIPEGKVATRSIYSVGAYALDNNVLTTTIIIATPGSGMLLIMRGDLAVWSASTNATRASGVIVFEIN